MYKKEKIFRLMEERKTCSFREAVTFHGIKGRLLKAYQSGEVEDRDLLATALLRSGFNYLLLVDQYPDRPRSCRGSIHFLGRDEFFDYPVQAWGELPVPTLSQEGLWVAQGLVRHAFDYIPVAQSSGDSLDKLVVVRLMRLAGCVVDEAFFPVEVRSMKPPRFRADWRTLVHLKDLPEPGQVSPASLRRFCEDLFGWRKPLGYRQMVTEDHPMFKDFKR